MLHILKQYDKIQMFAFKDTSNAEKNEFILFKTDIINIKQWARTKWYMYKNIHTNNKSKGSEMIMEQEKTYEIYTDASFDEETKLGIYSIVIVQEQKIIKSIAKKCNIELENSTECEVFAIFRAINIIEGSLLKKKIAQKFWLRTDCAVAKDFFIENNNKVKIFRENQELLNTIKRSYERVRKRLAKKDCSFKLKWVPRGANKLAHKCSYSAFQKLKKITNKDNIIIIDQKSFIELLQRFNSKQLKIITYLFQISNEQSSILKTQSEIAKSLDISISSVNQIFRELINLNILEKIKNGKYNLII